jgi:hypothetical protein
LSTKSSQSPTFDVSFTATDCLSSVLLYSSILPPHLNDTHISLIPKKIVYHLPSDLKPIILCNVVYKITVKSLVNRLKLRLSDYIHPSQQAFIEGSGISNNNSCTRYFPFLSSHFLGSSRFHVKH